MATVNLHTVTGPITVDTADVIWVSQPPFGGWATVLLRDGKSHEVLGDAGEIGNNLECYLQGGDQDRGYWINENAVTHVQEQKSSDGEALTLFFPNDLFIVIPNVSEDIFRYALECARANREGRPIPPQPKGVIVR